MRKIYKVLLLMLVMNATFILSACNSSNMSGIKNLTQQQIYTQKEDRYYVFFYRENCSGCEEVKPYVLKYVKQAKKNSKARKIYGFNLSDEKNKLIYRTNPDKEHGQGSYINSSGETVKGIFFVDEVQKWDDLYIGTTPSLISVRVIDGVKKSYFICSGHAKIIDTLNSELNK